MPIYYDPILAKLIVWSEDKGSACDRMVQALQDYVVLGIKTCIDFLKDVIDHPQFRQGQTNTDFIDRYLSDWQQQEKPDELVDMALLAAAFDSHYKGFTGTAAALPTHEVPSPWMSLGKWRIGEGK